MLRAAGELAGRPARPSYRVRERAVLGEALCCFTGGVSCLHLRLEICVVTPDPSLYYFLVIFTVTRGLEQLVVVKEIVRFCPDPMSGKQVNRNTPAVDSVGAGGFRYTYLCRDTLQLCQQKDLP